MHTTMRTTQGSAVRIVALGSALGLVSIAGACTGVATDGEPPTTTTTGLPCDVAQVLESRCTSCHSSPPVAGALMSLVSRDDLLAPTPSNPDVTVAQRSVERMSAPYSAMPPGAGDAEDAPILQAWIDAGMPAGDCTPVATPDPAFTGPSVCTSGEISKWGEDPPNRLDMYPGRACNDCHANSNEFEPLPIFAAAGTVYPTGHEPDDCIGVDGTALTDVLVVVTGADGKSFNTRPRKSGNFAFGKIALTLPYTAKVVSSAGERVMSGPQMNGDCNLCHTDQGAASNGSATAPGRIVVPY